ncbi:UbiD family decarboxylase [Salicibibacter cibi]|uniref:UbiD family decarboxylase n=1 Tax=Salicibibacter cibi TaxID=2743001 RepID=UPI001FEA59B7|nr:UbiD family decarboxylase [Salicibibacter cibi]
MNPVSMRNLIERLENKNLLYCIKKEVDPKFELGAVVKTKDGKEPFLFDSIKGYDSSMIAGLGGDRELMADSIGVSSSELVPSLVESIVHPIKTNTVSSNAAPVHENVVYPPFKLDEYFPIPTFHAEDCGPYYVSGVLVVKEPNGEKRYTSIRRMGFIGDNRTNIAITSPELQRQYSMFEQNNEPLEVAVMFGVVPAVVLASQVSTHLFHSDKLNVASALLGQSLDVVQCRTVDLEVLAEAEIVLEGRMLPYERDSEGTFAELGGYYGGDMPQPIVEMSALTYRKNAISQTIFPASAEEKLPMCLVREMTLFRTIRQVVDVKSVHVTMAAAARLHAVVQIEKKTDGDGKQAAMAAFASDKDLKHVVVVDDDVDLYNPEDVEWAIATRVQADMDITIMPGGNGSPLEASHNLRGSRQKWVLTLQFLWTKKRNLDEYLYR